MILTDEQIAGLILESKTIPKGLLPLGSMTERHLHRRKEFRVTGAKGNEFTLALRLSTLNPLDFSAILGYRMPGTFQIFRLRRYNGKSHYHSNKLENGKAFYDFHIHTATERYQIPGFKEDSHAVTTGRYFSLESAIDCLLTDCGFRDSIVDGPLFSGQME